MRTTKEEIKTILTMHAAVFGLITTVFLIAAIPAFIGSGPALDLSDSVQKFGDMTGNPYMRP